MMPATVFKLPIIDRWLIHAPLVEVDALVNQSAMRHLETGQTAGRADLAELQGLLAERIDPPQPKHGPFDPDFLGLIATRACNIACAYCDFGGPTARKVDLDPEIAVAAIDWYAAHLAAAGRPRLKVHLFGGEPFHAPEAVDLIVHYTRAVCARMKLEPWLEVSTNGVFNEARAQFVGDYFDVVVLSFDGPPEIHDRNRPAFAGRPTYAVVEQTARRLSRSPVELCLRACVTQDSVEQMESITEWMCREFQPAVINHEPLTLNALTREAGLLPPNPFDFAAHWIRSRRIASKYGVKLAYSAAEAETPQLSSCPVGSDTLIVSMDGRASACYMLPADWQSKGMDFDMAQVRAGGGLQVNQTAVERIRNFVTDKPRCRECFCRWSCAGGCHVTHSYLNCATEYNEFCHQTRLITAFLALERMGASDEVDRLLASPESMQTLATQRSDVVHLSEHAAS